eukprot:scaffold292180_cov29-Prasinocladus_malaysianus.AAC.1
MSGCSTSYYCQRPQCSIHCSISAASLSRSGAIILSVQPLASAHTQALKPQLQLISMPVQLPWCPSVSFHDLQERSIHRDFVKAQQVAATWPSFASQGDTVNGNYFLTWDE